MCTVSKTYTSLVDLELHYGPQNNCTNAWDVTCFALTHYSRVVSQMGRYYFGPTHYQ